MKKSSDEGKPDDRWLNLMKSVVLEPEWIRCAGALVDYPRFDTFALRGHGSKEATELKRNSGERDFFVRNFRKLIKFGVVFAGSFYGYYRWRYCDSSIAIPIEFVIDMLKAERGVEVSETEVGEMIKLGFLPESGQGSLPFFAKDRMALIKKLRQTHPYTDSQMREMMEFEDRQMRNRTPRIPSYDSLECLNLASKGRKSESRARKALRDLFDLEKGEMKIKAEDHNDRCLVIVESLRFGHKNFDRLSIKERREVDKVIECAAWWAESMIQFEVLYSRMCLLAGYSPQIAFRPKPFEFGIFPGMPLMENIDWKLSRELIESMDLSFASTPVFKVEAGKTGLVIETDTKTSVSKSLRMAEKAATALAKRIDIARAKHGTVSEKARRHKQQITERNQWLKKRFRELRALKPSTAAYTIFNTLKRELSEKAEWAPDIGSKSHDIRDIEIGTIQRIVYRGS